MIAITIKGLDRLAVQLSKAFERNKKRTLGNLIRAGFVIQAESQRRCPVLTGNLRASAFTRWSKDLDKDADTSAGMDAAESLRASEKLTETDRHDTVVQEAQSLADSSTQPNVIVGHSASYAVYVHENMEAKHTSGQAKFLQAAVADNMSLLRTIIKA